MKHQEGLLRSTVLPSKLVPVQSAWLNSEATKPRVPLAETKRLSLPVALGSHYPRLGSSNPCLQTQQLRLMLHLNSTPPHGENERDPPARGKITETARGARSPQSCPFPSPPLPSGPSELKRPPHPPSICRPSVVPANPGR